MSKNAERVIVALLILSTIANGVTAVELVRMARNGFNVELSVEQAEEILSEANEAKDAAFKDMEGER